MAKSSVKNMERSIPMPSNSNALKERIPASIPVYSNTVNPSPGALGTLLFEGSNVTNFLDQ